MTPELWKINVGSKIAERRNQLFDSRRAAATAAGIPEASWRMAESGDRSVAQGVIVPAYPSKAVRRGIVRALKWPEDAIERLENGEDPATFEYLVFPEGATTAAGGDLNDLSLTAEEHHLVLGYIAGLRARR